MAGQVISVRPIGAPDVGPVGDFLNRHLNPRVQAAAWRAAMQPPWGNGPNSGFLMTADDELVGAYLAVYSQRDLGEGPAQVCNLAAFCVLEPYRAQSLRLVRALLGQKGLLFTDLSPSGNVVALNERLGFRRLDTTTWLAANLPHPGRRGTTVSSDPGVIGGVLRGRDADVFADHSSAGGARHLVVRNDRGYGYLVFRRDRRKGLPLFASALYAGGDAGVLRGSWPLVASHLLTRHRLPFTLAEPRILGFAPPVRAPWRRARPKMVRGVAAGLEGIDYLYSELALVDW